MSAKPVRFIVAAGWAWAFSSAACTGSESVDVHRDAGSVVTGAGGEGAGAGGEGAGAGAGTTGAAGTGSSVSGSGGAGAGGHAGAAPSTGSAGTKGAAGTSATGTGTAGTGAAGAGSTGAAGTGAPVDAGAVSTDPNGNCAGVKVYTYSAGIENILIQNCGGCHYAAPGVNVQGGFSFSYANVTGVTNGHPSCPNLDASKRRVVPGKPDNSLLWIKAFVNSPPAACGGHMPFQGSRLSDPTLCYIKAWILAGAPQ